MPTQQGLIDQQAEQEALRLQQEEEAKKQAAQTTKTTTQTTPGVERIEGDFGGQEAFKVKGRPVNFGGETVVENRKVLNKEFSQDATPGGWMLPHSMSEEQVNRAFTPIAGEKPKLDQAKLDRLARMGRINEAGRVVGVAADVLGLGLGANVNKRPTDDLAAKLFDENDNVYKKLDDDKNKYRDKVARWINGRNAKPVYDTVTTTKKTNDIRETENVLLKTKPKDGAGGKDNTFNIYNNKGQVVATVEKDKAMKAVSMMEQDPNISATDANSVRLMKMKMAEGSISDNEIYYLTQALALKYPSVRTMLGVSDNNSERPAGETVPFKEGLNVNGKNMVVSDLNNADPSQREAIAQRNAIQGLAGNEPVAQLNLGGTTIDVSKGDYEAAKIAVLSDPKNRTLKDEKEIHNKVMQYISNTIKQGQSDQYRNPDGTPKPAAKITATGNDPLEF